MKYNFAKAMIFGTIASVCIICSYNNQMLTWDQVVGISIGYFIGILVTTMSLDAK